MNKTMFVLGASGFVGMELVRVAISEGWTVKALARSQRSYDQLKSLGAVAIMGEAVAPRDWIADVRNSNVLIDLIQPIIPKRLTTVAIEKLSLERQSLTRNLIAALQDLSRSERPLLMSVSGTDDLE